MKFYLKVKEFKYKMKQSIFTYEEALFKAAAYCSQSEHCVSELREKLELWGVKPSEQDKIIKYLIQEKYIDENRFAQAYVKDKFRYNKWGKGKIRMMLYAKKIDKQVIETALVEIEDDEYRLMIKKLIDDKSKKITYKNDYERKGKLFRFLASKGFDSDIVSDILNIKYV